MNDFSETTKADTTIPETTKQLSPDATKSIQGWTAQDGGDLHRYYEYAVEDALDETALQDSGCREVFSEFPTAENGRIDTFIKKDNKGLIVDYKSHDMSDWSVSEAIRQAQDHGRQVQNYMASITESEGIDSSNVWGHIILVGKLPKDKEALEAYQTTLNTFNVGMETSSTGEEKDIVDIVKGLTQKHNL